MASTYTVLLSELVSEFKLDFFYRSTDFEKIHVTVDDISRPGLHLAGFFDHYEPMRVYVCGTVETAYLQKLTPEERIIIFDHFLSYKCPALIFARGFEPMPECLEMAKKYDCPFVDNEMPYGRVPQGHPVIVDYFYHEEIKGSDNTGARNKKEDK